MPRCSRSARQYECQSPRNRRQFEGLAVIEVHVNTTAHLLSIEVHVNTQAIRIAIEMHVYRRPRFSRSARQYAGQSLRNRSASQ